VRNTFVKIVRYPGTKGKNVIKLCKKFMENGKEIKMGTNVQNVKRELRKLLVASI
jgi:hypothetical protein